MSFRTSVRGSTTITSRTIKLVDSLDLDGEIGKERACVYFNFPFTIKLAIGLNVFQRSSTNGGSFYRFLAQFFTSGRIAKLPNDILMFQQHHGESLLKHRLVSRTYYKKSLIMALTFGSKTITDRIAGTLPINTVKNQKLSTYPVLCARSYPSEDPQCSTQTHGSIKTITIPTEQQSASYNNGEKENKKEEDNPENIHVDPLFTFRYIKEDGDVMFIEIILKDDDSRKEEPKAEGQEVEYFDIFPTRSKLAYHNMFISGAAYEWFKKDCIGSITTWDDLVGKFVQKCYQLSDHNEEIEEDDDPDDITDIFKIEGNLFNFETPFGTYEGYELNNPMTKDTEEPWLDKRVPYQLCDHICEPYRFKNRVTKWPTCSSDIDGFCNGGELPGMVRVGSMTYFQDHKWYDELAYGILKEETLMHKAKVEESWGNATPGVIKFCAWVINSFGNFYELHYNVLVKLQECWWKINANEVATFTHLESYGQRPYANNKTERAHNPYLEVNNIFDRNYDTSNPQENQGHEECRDNPTLEPSVFKTRRFEMMKYSFNADEEYIAIKESEYLNHLKDSLDAYREILSIIDEGWVVVTPDEE
ncbi:hypothetical protein Tco_0410630 [Tanacetum coccineum]